MTTAINAQTVSQGANLFNRPILSQYLDDDDSLFSKPVYNLPIGDVSGANVAAINPAMNLAGVGYGGLGMFGYGYGAFNNSDYVDNYVNNSKKLSKGMYELAGNDSDNQTSLAFKQRGNAYTLNTTSDILANTLKNMKYHIDNGDLQTATEEFDQVCSAIGKDSGLEMKTQQERVNAQQSIRAEVAKYYDQVNQSSLRDDIMGKGDGFFVKGIKTALHGGDYAKNSAEETVSYMTGTGIQSYASKQSVEKAGEVVGYAAPAATGAAIGAAVGGVPGAIIGGALGLAYTLISSAVGKNPNDHVTTY